MAVQSINSILFQIRQRRWDGLESEAKILQKVRFLSKEKDNRDAVASIIMTSRIKEPSDVKFLVQDLMTCDEVAQFALSASLHAAVRL